MSILKPWEKQYKPGWTGGQKLISRVAYKLQNHWDWLPKRDTDSVVLGAVVAVILLSMAFLYGIGKPNGEGVQVALMLSVLASFALNPFWPFSLFALMKVLASAFRAWSGSANPDSVTPKRRPTFPIQLQEPSGYRNNHQKGLSSFESSPTLVNYAHDPSEPLDN